MQGREQAGMRLGLVLSEHACNERSGSVNPSIRDEWRRVAYPSVQNQIPCSSLREGALSCEQHREGAAATTARTSRAPRPGTSHRGCDAHRLARRLGNALPERGRTPSRHVETRALARIRRGGRAHRSRSRPVPRGRDCVHTGHPRWRTAVRRGSTRPARGDDHTSRSNQAASWPRRGWCRGNSQLRQHRESKRFRLRCATHARIRPCARTRSRGRTEPPSGTSGRLP